MHEHWEYNRNRSQSMSNDRIDRWYDVGLKNGALGGKLVGAGFTGLAPDPANVERLGRLTAALGY